MSLASLLSIQVTSPITHMVSAAVRGVAASLLGMWLFHDFISTYVFPHSLILLLPQSHHSPSGRASSIAIILLGSFYYTWVKNQETKKPAPPANGYERVSKRDVESGKPE